MFRVRDIFSQTLISFTKAKANVKVLLFSHVIDGVSFLEGVSSGTSL